MFGIFSIFLILTYHSSVATAWTTVAAVVEFCPSSHCRGGPRYQNDISRIPDRLWKENNVVPFQRFVGANLNWFGARNVQVVASLYYISPPVPPTHPLPQEEDDQDYLLIDKESRLVNNSDSTRTIHQTTPSLFNQVGQFGPIANMLFHSQYFFCLNAVCRSSQIFCSSPPSSSKCSILIIYDPPPDL